MKDAIDVHCHAHEGQPDALALAKHASKSEMRGILYKTTVGRDRPAEAVRGVQAALEAWSEAEGVRPIQCWAGYNVAHTGKPPSAAATRAQLEDGVVAVWMPVAMHAKTLSKVGGRKVFRLVAEYDRAVFFAHATHPEIWAMAEEVDRLGIKQAVVDHPFSPFVDLSVEQMQELARVGVYLNFTYDELSPLLGVDPMQMYRAIRAVGVEQVTLSSDAGEPLFPNTVEAMRQIRAYMRAFGLSDEEVHQVSSINPGKVVGLS